MPQEILIYGAINQDLTKEFVKDLEAATQDGIVIRIDTDGGNPECGFSIIAKLNEYQGKKSIKNDGRAYSTGTFLNCYVEDSECLDTTNFLIHRAAYPSYYENDPEFFDEATKQNLNRINASLQKALFAKIDVQALQEIMDSRPELNGAKVKDIFSLDSRIDVNLNATEAKKIGLVNRIVKITPSKAAELKGYVRAAAMGEIPKPKKENQNPENMTIEALKAQFPEVYNALIKKGAKKERDRVGAYLVFIDADKKAVLEGIESGEPLSQTAMADLTLKMTSKEALKTTKEEGADDVTTTESAEEKEAKKLADKNAADQKKKDDFMASFRAEAGLGKRA